MHPTDRDDNYVLLSKEDYELCCSLFPKVWSTALFSKTDGSAYWFFAPLLRSETSRVKIEDGINDKYMLLSPIYYVITILSICFGAFAISMFPISIHTKILIVISLLMLVYIGYLKRQLMDSNKKLAIMLLSNLFDKT